MIRFLSPLPPEQIARELATALGNAEPPTLGGVARDEAGAIDATAPHWYTLAWDGDERLYPHDIDGDGPRTFDLSYYDDARLVLVRAALARLQAIEIPQEEP